MKSYPKVRGVLKRDKNTGFAAKEEGAKRPYEGQTDSRTRTCSEKSELARKITKAKPHGQKKREAANNSQVLKKNGKRRGERNAT